jgi:hypothetical protein
MINSRFYLKKHPREQQNLKDKFFTGGEKNFRTAPGVKLGNLYEAKIFFKGAFA